MISQQFITHSAEETIACGREIAARMKPPALVLLSGELGAGKTTLTKGIASGLGVTNEEEVTSPTFTLVHTYEHDSARGVRVYHVDLYRVGDFHDLETLGLEDVFSENAIVIVEWPEKLSLRTDWPVIRIHLEHIREEERRISIAEGKDLEAASGR